MTLPVPPIRTLRCTRDQRAQAAMLGAVLLLLFRRASPRHILERERCRMEICLLALLACRARGIVPDETDFTGAVRSALSRTHREVREREALEIFPDAQAVALLAQELLLDHFRERLLSLHPH